ncbi:hypothetical protein N8I77_011752 [Diaporthe amygdali]|uniref:Uncharacterized protein n=1 Tax=Phomopsis amygdali TaxID=1214568 RepID=A0AAD9VXJ4_PHOAM|nr:uncharacterized protein J7T55_002927 [Diaporthe amygdali]KAJ0122414.1 hypothetical protein J7T55_002927 [Diaporthe amygdali]KAK2598332.1 hypothetical protein N8I77_011752 [Diaporthe amygdali]
MLPRAIYLSLIFSFFFNTALSYPTWFLAVFQFRCKAPSIVESYSEDWKEWRVSSICAPGTCCATSAATGPLCTVEACEKADQERERKLKSYNAVQASKKKTEEAKKAKEILSKSSESETKWKVADSQAEADRQKALAEIQLSA